MKLLFNICLSLLGFGAIILEFFVPSAGIIGLIGAGCVITGIVFTYLDFGAMIGTIFLSACAIIGPVIMFLYFKLFPRSFFGKKLILHKEFDTQHGFVSGEPDTYRELIGKEGVVESKLRPVGKVTIDDIEYNATTTSDFIDKGCVIKVIKVEGNTIVVTPKEL